MRPRSTPSLETVRQRRIFRRMAMPTQLSDTFRRLEERDPCIDLRAYVFVLHAVREVTGKLPERRHISGGELLEGVKNLAVTRYGLTARMVLEHWGVTATEDIGDIVFALADVGLLVKTEDDRPEDFENVFDFAETFEKNYSWGL